MHIYMMTNWRNCVELQYELIENGKEVRRYENNKRRKKQRGFYAVDKDGKEVCLKFIHSK